MKKILILNPYIPTLGGGEKHMGYLCQFMEQYFSEVIIEILVFNYNDINVDDEDYVTIEDINKQFSLDLKKTKILKLRSKDIPVGLSFEKYLSKMTKGYDLFINFMIFSRLPAEAKTNIYECMFPPISYTLEDKSTNFVDRIKRQIKDRRFLKSYDAFVPNSQYSNEWFLKYWGTVNRNYVIYPPVFAEHDLEARYDEKKKENIIISVGRFFVDAHSKKQLEMVEFFVKNQDSLKEYQYHLVGAISNYQRDIDYLNKIKEIAAQYDNIFIHENCPYDVLMDLYARAKIFWHATGYGVNEEDEPEKMEHFGITTVEAMSFGVVPVVINKGGQKETVEEGVSGYLWDSEKQCIEKTMHLVLNDTIRGQMALEAAKRARKFSIEEFYKRNRVIFDGLHI